VLLLQKIRSDLGAKKHLLDDFLYGMLVAFNKISVIDAVDEGFQDATAEFRNLVIGIRDGDDSLSGHPFYPTLWDYIIKNPCPDERVYVDYYCASLFVEFTDFALTRYLRNRETHIKAEMDAANIDALKAGIAEVVDIATLDKLYDLIYKRYIIASPAKIFVQCMNDQHLLCNLFKAGDSQFVYQYILDEKFTNRSFQ